MKSSTLSKIDKIVWYLQLAVMVGVLLSGLIFDPVFWLFSPIFTTVISVGVLLTMIVRLIKFPTDRKFRFMVVGITLVWIVGGWLFLWYAMRDLPSGFMM